MRTRFVVAILGAAVLSLSLTSCREGTSADALGSTGAGNTAPGSTGASAAAFVACLKGQGVPAKLSDAGAMVMVPGRALGVVVDQTDSAISASVAAADPSDSRVLLLTEVDEAGTWVAPLNSDSVSSDSEIQAAYQSCEAKFPDFRQPSLAAAGTEMSKSLGIENTENALRFAKCAREHGFSWLEDPSPETGAINLPPDLSQEDFRALLDACWVGGEPFSWTGSDNLADLMGVLAQYDQPVAEN